MKEKEHTLCVISPGYADGGANLLMGRAAMHLAREHGHRLHLVDVAGGAVWRLWTKEGVEFTFQAYERGRNLEIDQCDTVLISLLGAKLIGTRFIIADAVRLILWCTAPQDPFKFIPWSFFANKWAWKTRSTIASVLSRSHKRRIGDFLRTASGRGGVFFMDEHNFAVNESMFGPGITPAILPICTASPYRPPRASYVGRRSAYWVGRVADFKTHSLVATAKSLLASGKVDDVVVIGDGEDLPEARAKLDGLPVKWLGSLSVDELEKEIHEKAWIVFGHATSLLEAAKLGIPALLVDGTYDRIRASELRVEWLYRCSDGYVGAIVPVKCLTGRTATECLLEAESDYRLIAQESFERWKRSHSPKLAAGNLARAIRNGQYTVGEYLASGASRPGIIGGFLEQIKQRVFRRIY